MINAITAWHAAEPTAAVCADKLDATANVSKDGRFEFISTDDR
jgi:hypothetical protein